MADDTSAPDSRRRTGPPPSLAASLRRRCSFRRRPSLVANHRPGAAPATPSGRPRPWRQCSHYLEPGLEGKVARYPGQTKPRKFLQVRRIRWVEGAWFRPASRVSLDTGSGGREPAPAPAEHRLPRPVLTSKPRPRQPERTSPPHSHWAPGLQELRTDV